MKDLIKTIRKEIASLYKKNDTVKLEVLFSESHADFVVLVNDQNVDYEIGVENTLKIYEYTKRSTGNNNRLIVTIKEDKITEKFDFDEDYFISSNQEFLYLMIDKIKGNLNIEDQELIDLLSIAEYAITKVDVKNVASQACKLYLTIESCQLVTDISPDFIKNNGKYLFLCEISGEDIQQSNLENIILQKINHFYK